MAPHISREQNELDIYHVSHLFEIWQQTIPSPAIIAKLFPTVVIRLRATIEDHAVEFRRASNDLAKRDRYRAIGNVLSWNV
jgi:hypothetical protein